MPHCAVVATTTTPLVSNNSANVESSVINTRRRNKQVDQDLSKKWSKVKNYVNTLETRAGLIKKNPAKGRTKAAAITTASVSKLNIHERPVRKKKKNKKYENYVPELKVTSPVDLPECHNETNVLLALGLRPVCPNGLTKMHVTEEMQPEKGAVSVQHPADPVTEPASKKTVAVAAATTTVEDAKSVGDVTVVEAETEQNGEEEKRESDSPKINGVCDSAGDKKGGETSEVDGAKCNGNNIIKEEPTESSEREQVTGNDVSIRVKDDEDDAMAVESSEPQDLTVTCTSTYETSRMVNRYPTSNYISISVEQCQTGTNEHDKKPKTIINRKRSAKSSDSEDGCSKRFRDDREQTVSDYVNKASGSGLEELQQNAEKLQQEIHSLSALARKKEAEWNDIIRMKNLKEEMYTRLLRRKQVLLLGMGGRPPDGVSPWSDYAAEFFASDEVSLNRVKSPRVPSNLTITKAQPNMTSQQLQRFLMNPQQQQQQHHHHHRGVKINKTGRLAPFPILPKPSPAEQSPPSLGRQGATVDVKSLIADYRQSHPEQIPRRGRRMRPHMPDNIVSSSRGVLSMSSIALGSGSQVRTVGSTSGPTEEVTSRPSSADSSRSEVVSFKDILVHYAKTGASSKPPPPYPEVTLHPVVGTGSSSTPSGSGSPPQHSLLHGILTATAGTGTASTKPTTFSPTLARLLTTPDRPSTTTTITTALKAAGTSSTSSAPAVSITELLSTSKKRNELTITPVVTSVQSSRAAKEEPANQNEEDLDDSDRLVIDESEDTDGRAAGDDSDAVPECQGCHREPAQFVCAGCGNQWYCSRHCQVNAWDEHSEVCSG